MRLQMTRDKDILDLRILDMWDGDKMSAVDIGRRLGMTRNAVLGRIHRMKHEPLPCQCRKPENRDGGMRRGWWR